MNENIFLHLFVINLLFHAEVLVLNQVQGNLIYIMFIQKKNDQHTFMSQRKVEMIILKLYVLQKKKINK